MNLEAAHDIKLLDRIGLIAGNGTFPLEFVRQAKTQGIQVYVVAHYTETDPEIETLADKTLWIRVGELGKLIKFFETNALKQVAMAGGIRRPKLFGGVRPDLRAIALIARLRSVHDDVLLRGVAQELENSGIEVIAATALLDKCVPSCGLLTSRDLTEMERKNAAIGVQAVRLIGQLDIGQCVVVNQEVVVAVEAVEGTDATILRAGELSGKGSVVVKLAKPQQDLRFDLPAIGPQTIQNMQLAGATALVLGHRQTLMLEAPRVLELAQSANIAIRVIEPESFTAN